MGVKAGTGNGASRQARRGSLRLFKIVPIPRHYMLEMRTYVAPPFQSG